MGSEVWLRILVSSLVLRFVFCMRAGLYVLTVESGGFPADMEEDDRKLCFCLRALDAQDPFELEACELWSGV